MIDEIWRIFKRIVFLIGVILLGMNLITWVVLNSPPVQKMGLKWINQAVLQPYQVELTWDSLSLNFFSSKLNLNGAKLRFQDPNDDTLTNSIGSVSLEKFSVGLDLLSSYLNRKAVLRSASADGLVLQLEVDRDGKLRLPKFLKGGGDGPESPVNVPTLMTQIRTFLPPEISLRKSRFKLGSEVSLVQADVGLDELVLLNFQSKAESVPLSVRMKLGDSLFRWSDTHGTVQLKMLETDFKLTNRLNIENLGLKLETLAAGRLSLKGRVDVPWKDQSLFYKAEAEASEIDLGLVLHALGLKSQGQVSFKGTVFSHANLSQKEKPEAKKPNYIPQAEGNVVWKGVEITGIQVYAGQGEIKLQNKRLGFKKTRVQTQKGGVVDAEGFFDLEGAFPFEAKAQIKTFPFVQLLSGFGVKTEAMDFKLATAAGAELQARGQIRGPGKSPFWLTIAGQLQTLDLLVPSMEEGNKFKLPKECRVSVLFRTDEFGLDLDGSRFSCREDHEDSGVVSKGKVDYVKGVTEFVFDWQDADLSSAGYFLGQSTKGVGSVSGKVFASPTSPVRFEGLVDLEDVLLYGTRYSALAGNLLIDGNKTAGKGFKGVFETNESAKPWIYLDNFEVQYGKDLQSKFEGRLGGNLSEIRKSSLDILGADFPEVQGSLEKAEVLIKGPLLRPEEWILETQLQLPSFGWKSFSAKMSSLKLSCSKGLCAQSLLSFAGAQWGESGKNEGSLVVSVDQLSRQAIKASLQARRMSFALENEKGIPFSGVLETRAQIEGPWSSWQGSLQASANSLIYGEKDLGFLTLSGYSTLGSDFDLRLSTRSDQVQLRALIPHSFQGKSSLYVSAKEFDPSFLVSLEFLKKWNFVSQVSGEFLLEGPAPFSTWSPEQAKMFSWESGEEWWRVWKGEGSLNKGNLQLKQVMFDLEKRARFSVGNSLLKLDTLSLKSKSGRILLSGQHDLAESRSQFKVDTDLDLALLEGLTTGISQAGGRLKSSLTLKSSDSGLDTEGEIKVQGGSFSFVSYPPAFTQIEAELLLKNSRVEIRSFSSKKGKGSLDLAGSVDFSETFSSADRGPALALRLTAKEAQFGVPAPYVESFDTLVDANLDLSGKTKPYLLSGDLRILKASTYRDKTCQDLLASERATKAEELGLGTLPFANFNVKILAERSISIQTTCLKSNLSANVNLVGSTKAPLLTGLVEANGGSVSFLKSNFSIVKSEFVFDNPVRLDPRIDLQLLSKIEAYNVYVAVDGTLSKRRTNLWVDPPSTPDGASIGRPDIFRMLATGQPPNRAGTQSQALVSQVAGYFYGATAFDESLSQAAQRLTGGIVESVRLQPVIESGQTRWRARVSRSLGDRLSLGLDIEQGQFVNNQSINGTVYVNESVNVLGGFDRKSEQSDQYYELSGGLRFQFGSGR